MLFTTLILAYLAAGDTEDCKCAPNPVDKSIFTCAPLGKHYYLGERWRKIKVCGKMKECPMSGWYCILKGGKDRWYDWEYPFNTIKEDVKCQSCGDWCTKGISKAGFCNEDLECILDRDEITKISCYDAECTETCGPKYSKKAEKCCGTPCFSTDDFYGIGKGFCGRYGECHAGGIAAPSYHEFHFMKCQPDTDCKKQKCGTWCYRQGGDYGKCNQHNECDPYPRWIRCPLTEAPTMEPTTLSPTLLPGTTHSPTIVPTRYPSACPTVKPTGNPSIKPTQSPTIIPTLRPTLTPTFSPVDPTFEPTPEPTVYTPPSLSPTACPTVKPSTAFPSIKPTGYPSIKPTPTPTRCPTTPTAPPTSEPTRVPTESCTAKERRLCDQNICDWKKNKCTVKESACWEWTWGERCRKMSKKMKVECFWDDVLRTCLPGKPEERVEVEDKPMDGPLKYDQFKDWCIDYVKRDECSKYQCGPWKNVLQYCIPTKKKNVKCSKFKSQDICEMVGCYFKSGKCKGSPFKK